LVLRTELLDFSLYIKQSEILQDFAGLTKLSKYVFLDALYCGVDFKIESQFFALLEESLDVQLDRFSNVIDWSEQEPASS